jgi:hypothetical protein
MVYEIFRLAYIPTKKNGVTLGFRPKPGSVAQNNGYRFFVTLLIPQSCPQTSCKANMQVFCR